MRACPSPTFLTTPPTFIANTSNRRPKPLVSKHTCGMTKQGYESKAEREREREKERERERELDL